MKSVNKEKYKIVPRMTLSSIYGPGSILDPRASFSRYGWLPYGPGRLDFLTGAPLTVAGSMPVICSSCVAAESVISLLSKEGLEITPFRYVYSTKSEYQEILDFINKRKQKLVVNHLHPPTEIEPESYWINREIMAFLNNKANLRCLVPEGHIPQRAVIPPTEIIKNSQAANYLPFVLKAAVEQPTGGGYGIFICKNKEDIDNAYQHLRRCETVVLEEYLEIVKNFNIQFAITTGGQIIYLGASEQLTDPAGFYTGNWLIRNQVPPQLAVDLSLTIVQKAYRLGYVGIAGLDVVVAKGNQVLVIDLNFRLNGSTPALLLQDSIFETYQAPVMLFRSWKPRVEWNRFDSIFSELLEHSHLIPLSFYEPQNPFSNDVHYFSGILAGDSKEDVLRKQQILAKQN